MTQMASHTVEMHEILNKLREDLYDDVRWSAERVEQVTLFDLSRDSRQLFETLLQHLTEDMCNDCVINFVQRYKNTEHHYHIAIIETTAANLLAIAPHLDNLTDEAISVMFIRNRYVYREFIRLLLIVLYLHKTDADKLTLINEHTNIADLCILGERPFESDNWNNKVVFYILFAAALAI